MMIFSKDMEITRSSLTIIASYSASLLEAGNLNIWHVLLFLQLGLQVTALVRLSFVAKHNPHSGFTSRSCLTLFPIEKPLLKSQPVLAPSLPDEVYIDYQTHSAQSPIELSAPTDLACIVLLRGRLVSTMIGCAWK